VDPETHSPLNPESPPTGSWEHFMKGKFKRRISGPGAVNLAHEDIQISSRHRHRAQGWTRKLILY
jgi:hypothetical protein